MALYTPTVLTKDVWVKVLTNVTTSGKVVIVDQDIEPTKYEFALVFPSGAEAPTDDYTGGLQFKMSINAFDNKPMDVYVKAYDNNGLVMIFP